MQRILVECNVQTFIAMWLIIIKTPHSWRQCPTSSLFCCFVQKGAERDAFAA